MKKEYYVVLHGAKKNAGDFLIKNRAMALLKHLKPERELIEFPHWKPLEDHLDVINKSLALVIMGGPGLQSNIYPRVYPLTKDLNQINVPIYLMGSGSYMLPFNSRAIETFQFTKSSLEFLNKCSGISVRDLFTYNLMKTKNFHKVSMTGCPAWYELNSINNPVKLPSKIKKIIVSAPQRKNYFPQLIDILKAIKARYSEWEIIVTFNRGFKADQYTSARVANYLKYYKQKIEELGIPVLNAAYNIDLLEEHNDADLHIGYRLHSHIHYFSIRKPSYLIAEDSRGRGNIDTIRIPGFSGIEHSSFADVFIYPNSDLIRNISIKLLPIIKLDKYLPSKLISQLEYDIDNNFSTYSHLSSMIDNNFKIMQRFIQTLP